MDKQHEQLLNKKLEIAGALEEMTNTKGWNVAHEYIEQIIKTFANESVLNGYETIADFNLKRGEVNGLRKFIGYIDDHLQTLYEYRQKNNSGSSTK